MMILFLKQAEMRGMYELLKLNMTISTGLFHNIIEGRKSGFVTN